MKSVKDYLDKGGHVCGEECGDWCRIPAQEKRWSNDKWSIDFLKSKGVEVQVLNASVSHYRIGDYDFWATTGKFINRKTNKAGRGVRNLYKLIST